jgi:hypothetical protein
MTLFRTAVATAALAAAMAVSATPAPVWFVVAETTPEHGDSFLLPLTDPGHIADARALIADGPGDGIGSIVAATIAPGGDGFNRDLQREGEPLWSWHVSGFQGFPDVAIELCDGWPGFIEQDVEAFIANTSGQVCFWGYTVVAELEEAPAFAIGEGLDGAWYDPATPGQGLFLDVFADRLQLGFGWYAFAPDAPGEQRWWTGLGSYSGDEAVTTLQFTSNGAFLQPGPVDTQPVGTATFRFSDCNTGTLDYAFDQDPSGTVPLRRLVPVAGCYRR